jgi:hypothetical protein
MSSQSSLKNESASLAEYSFSEDLSGRSNLTCDAEPVSCLLDGEPSFTIEDCKTCPSAAMYMLLRDDLRISSAAMDVGRLLCVLYDILTVCIRLPPLLIFKRLSLDDLANQEWLDDILKSAEIAPNRPVEVG